MVVDFKQIAWRFFTKQNGISLKADALKYLEEAFSHLLQNDDAQELSESLQFILIHWRRLAKISHIIEQTDLASILESLQKESQKTALLTSDGACDADLHKFIKIIDYKQFSNVTEREKHASNTARKISIELPKPDVKFAIMQERFERMKSRVLSSDDFCAEQRSPRKFCLSAISHLKGCTSSSVVYIFGLLSQMKEGVYFLEDLDCSIQLDLTNATCSDGVFCENCFVILEGVVNAHQVFEVRTMAMPPVSPATQRPAAHFAYAAVDDEANSVFAREDHSVIRRLEEKFIDAQMLFVFDVWLDDAAVMQKFFEICARYAAASAPPAVWVLGGRFARSLPSACRVDYEETLSRLFCDFFAQLTARFPTVCRHARFVIVPSYEDAEASHALPKPPIFLPEVAEFVANRPPLTKAAGGIDDAAPFDRLQVHFAGNPVRIRHFTQEICVLHDDLTSRLQRNCVLLPTEGETGNNGGGRQLVHTLFHQAHLCPFSAAVRPVDWRYEASLRLDPLPDLLVLFDRCERFVVGHADGVCANPGSFPSNDFRYLVYSPASRQIALTRADE